MVQINAKYIIFNPGVLTDSKLFLNTYYFKKLSKNFKICSLNTDSNGFDATRKLMNDFRKFSFCTILLDSVTLARELNDTRVLFLHSPYRKSLFIENIAKDIDVSFVGRYSDSKPERKEYVEYLKNNGINVLHMGGRGQALISEAEYFDILKRSKISLNFGGNSCGRFAQLKGRVFEVMLANALLIEVDSAETKEIFLPGEEFISVKSKEEMLERVRFYLMNSKEAKRISCNGFRKVKTDYSGEIFWKKLFNQLEYLSKAGL